MGFTVFQLRKLAQGPGRVVVGGGGNGQGNEHLIGVQARVVVAQVLALQILYGLDNLGRDQVSLLRDPGQLLQRVQDHRGGRSEQVCGLAGDDLAVGQLNRQGRMTGGFRLGTGGGHHRTEFILIQVQLLHEQEDLFSFFLSGMTLQEGAAGGVVPADDFLLGSLTAGIVIGDAVAYHVHAHVSRALVGGLAPHMLEEGVEHREDLDIPVVVDGGLTVGFQMEGVDHVHVAQVCGGSFVSHVDRMFQRQVPDGEGFELGVAGLDTPAVFLVQLAEAGGHLAAAGSGRGDQHQGAGGFHIVVPAETVIADDVLYIGGISFNGVVTVGFDALGVQPLFKGDGGGLPGPAGEYHGAYVQADAPEGVDQPQGVQVVGDAQVPADFAGFDVVGVDRDQDFFLVLHLQQHLDLAVRLETGKDAAGVEVVKQLAAQLQIQLAAEFVDALHDALRLHLGIFVMVKTELHLPSFPLVPKNQNTKGILRFSGVPGQGVYES